MTIDFTGSARCETPPGEAANPGFPSKAETATCRGTKNGEGP